MKPKMKPGAVNNLYAGIRQGTDRELLDELLKTSQLRIERIVSHGQASPEGFWYDQDDSEWVLLLRGQAGLSLEGEEGTVILHPGDYLYIPAHLKHRVEWTAPEEETVWLAIYFPEEGPKA